MNIRFACNGCGRCCTDHHVPLTLQETVDWGRDGGQIIVLVEAFRADGPEMPPERREHALRRALAVPCGQATVHVAITFAAFNPGRCRNLDDDNRCRIYERRPLVCRIYPMEINPHIPLRPDAKDCPPETWQEGPVLLAGGQLVDADLAGLIERSRQADRDEIALKAMICQRLGIHTAAVRGEGFAAYLPDMSLMLQAILEVCQETDRLPAAQEWALHMPQSGFAAALRASGAKVVELPQQGCTYIALAK